MSGGKAQRAEWHGFAISVIVTSHIHLSHGGTPQSCEVSDEDHEMMKQLHERPSPASHHHLPLLHCSSAEIGRKCTSLKNEKEQTNEIGSVDLTL